MPKKKKTLKESKNSKLLNSYLNFIDSNFSGNTFTYRNVVDWLNDSEDTTGKNVNFIVAMLVKSWILSEYVVDNGDGTFTPIYFEDDEEEYSFKDVDIEDDERLGKPEFDDEYIRDYGNRDMRFPRINDSFDESKKVVKENYDTPDFESKEFFNEFKNYVYLSKYEGTWDFDIKKLVSFIGDINRDYVDEDIAESIIDTWIEFGWIKPVWKNTYEFTVKKIVRESKKTTMNERRTIIEKYVNARKHK